MKNNLLALKSSNIDARLPTHNDFLELIITRKMEEEGEFFDIMNEIRDILDGDDTFEEEDEDDLMEETEPFYYERLKMDSTAADPLDSNANSLLHAGYADCMEEAIRFLVEEENIAPEHPIVKNLKTHLEKSKDRVLQTLCFQEESLGAVGSESPLCDIFLETFQNCRDSG